MTCNNVNKNDHSSLIWAGFTTAATASFMALTDASTMNEETKKTFLFLLRSNIFAATEAITECTKFENDGNYIETIQNITINGVATLISSQTLQYQVVANGAIEVLQSMLRNQYEPKTLVESFISGAAATLTSRLAALSVLKFMPSFFDQNDISFRPAFAMFPGAASGACGQITRNIVHQRPISRGVYASLLNNFSNSIADLGIYKTLPPADVLPQNHLQRDYGRDSVRKEKQSSNAKALLQKLDSELTTVSSLASTSGTFTESIPARIVKIENDQKKLHALFDILLGAKVENKK